jgi:potassium/hydrogen antiporter
MQTELMLIGLAGAVILSHWFGLVAARWQLPAVVFLLLAGLLLRQGLHVSAIDLPIPDGLLALLGTVGLILIVLEGALDLRVDRSHGPLLARTSALAILAILVMASAIGFTLHALYDVDLLLCLLVATPFAIISSAVAIPSASHLSDNQREFVIYESSLSDIIGVMLFNALVVSVTATGSFTGNLVLGGLAVLVAGLALSIAMYVLIGHLDSHVKFAPMLFGLIGVYGVAKLLHLSPLLLVLILGLVLNNPERLYRLRLPARWHSPVYKAELDKLKHLTAEATFVVRTLFFLLLGFSTDLASLTSADAWIAAGAILLVLFGSRWALLKLLAPRMPVRTLVWLAPRGLITVLLYYSLPEAAQIARLPEGSLMLVVLLSCLVMAAGMRTFGQAGDGAPDTRSDAGQAKDKEKGKGKADTAPAARSATETGA